MPNYFEVLEVPTSASDQEITEAYLRKKKQYKAGDNREQNELLSQVELAYRVLCNPMTRKNYLRNLPPSQPDAKPLAGAPAAAGTPPAAVPESPTQRPPVSFGAGPGKRSKTEIFTPDTPGEGRGDQLPPASAPAAKRSTTQVLDRNTPVAPPAGAKSGSRRQVTQVVDDRQPPQPASPPKTVASQKPEPARKPTEPLETEAEASQQLRKRRPVTEVVMARDEKTVEKSFPPGDVVPAAAAATARREETLARPIEVEPPVKFLKVSVEMNEPGNLQKYKCNVGENLVGRPASSSNPQIPIDDPFVSRYHAVIIVEGQNCYLEDRKSKNGTLVNKKRIEKNRRVLLHHGDVVEIEGHQLKINIE